MRYQSTSDLPFVFRYNLCAAAQEAFCNAYNEVWQRLPPRRTDRDQMSLQVALRVVKREFARGPNGVWTKR
ncbi:MAG: ChaB family protein [Acidobacteria bacterium]|nr:ChaB family protein [Acidobacteriota bacterium]